MMSFKHWAFSFFISFIVLFTLGIKLIWQYPLYVYIISCILISAIIADIVFILILMAILIIDKYFNK